MAVKTKYEFNNEVKEFLNSSLQMPKKDEIIEGIDNFEILNETIIQQGRLDMNIRCFKDFIQLGVLVDNLYYQSLEEESDYQIKKLPNYAEFIKWYEDRGCDIMEDLGEC